jgi:hypothetical protein
MAHLPSTLAVSILLALPRVVREGFSFWPQIEALDDRWNRVRAHGLGSMHIITICEVRFALSSLPDAVCRTVFRFKGRKSPVAVPYYLDLEFSLPSFSSFRFYGLTLSVGCRSAL